MPDRCGCPDDAAYCPRYRVKVGRREHQYLRGTSGLPREKELAYAERILARAEPGLLAKLVGLAGAAARHALDGFRCVTDEEHAGRLAVCDVCEMCDKGPARWRCRACGCYLRDAKARWASEGCPQGRWALPLRDGGGEGGCRCGG
jgi:hypothetical protein